MTTPKEKILKKVQILLLRLRQPQPKQLEESSRKTAVAMLNLYIAEAKAAVTGVDEGLWPQPFADQDSGAGQTQRIGTKDQVATKARELLKLLAQAKAADQPVAAAATPAEPTANTPAQ